MNEFQFHKGSIKTILPYLLIGIYRGFNSTKVRLRLLYSKTATKSGTSFNSTKVRLRPDQHGNRIRFICGFNSTKVRFRHQERSQLPTSTVSFNSTQVRLRRAQPRPDKHGNRMFQFHKGSIKSQRRFTSNVRLEVSIPQRFD